MSKARIRIGLFILMAAGALAFFLVRMSPPGGITEADLQKTDGIRIQALGLEVIGANRDVSVELTNQTDRTARSVVFEVTLLDQDGQIIATNPLGNVLDLSPGDTRHLTIPLPLEAPAPPGSQPSAKISLVRWE